MIGRIRAGQKEFLLALGTRPGSQSATCSDLIKVIVFLVSVSRGAGANDLPLIINSGLMIAPLYGAVWYSVLLRIETVTRPHLKIS